MSVKGATHFDDSWILSKSGQVFLSLETVILLKVRRTCRTTDYGDRRLRTRRPAPVVEKVSIGIKSGIFPDNWNSIGEKLMH